ncbi:hypothetical protein Q3G72_021489 [Acer saccharum]|nr:hypothetical protein Q3G72_021489 [Acer saccharum]
MSSNKLFEAGGASSLPYSVRWLFMSLLLNSTIEYYLYLELCGGCFAEVEAEQKMLEEAIKNARERTLLRAMNKAKSNSSGKTPYDQGNKVGDIFPDAKGNNDEDIDNETGDGDHEDEVEDEDVNEDNVEDGDRVCN